MKNPRPKKGMSESDYVAFVDLLSRTQRKIYAYIMSLVANFNDADDIMQETSRIMWEKFEHYERGTNFLAWAKRIAFFQVLEFRKKRKALRERSIFNDEVFQMIQQETPGDSDVTDRYLIALRQCLKKLKPEDQEVLQLKYQCCTSVKDISNQYQRTVQSLYRTLGRIQELLMNCVRRTIAHEERL